MKEFKDLEEAFECAEKSIEAIEYLLETKPHFNWEIIKSNAEKTGTQVQINFAMKFITKV